MLFIYVDIDLREKGFTQINRFILIFGLIFFIGEFIFVCSDVRMIKKTLDEITVQKNLGITDVELEPFDLDFKTDFIRSEYVNLSSDTAFWSNKLCARYYRLNSIRVKTEIEAVDLDKER